MGGFGLYSGILVCVEVLVTPEDVASDSSQVRLQRCALYHGTLVLVAAKVPSSSSQGSGNVAVSNVFPHTFYVRDKIIANHCYACHALALLRPLYALVQ